jgi:hypothetical protein
VPQRKRGAVAGIVIGDDATSVIGAVPGCALTAALVKNKTNILADKAINSKAAI